LGVGTLPGKKQNGKKKGEKTKKRKNVEKKTVLRGAASDAGGVRPGKQRQRKKGRGPARKKNGPGKKPSSGRTCPQKSRNQGQTDNLGRAKVSQEKFLTKKVDGQKNATGTIKGTFPWKKNGPTEKLRLGLTDFKREEIPRRATISKMMENRWSSLTG